MSLLLSPNTTKNHLAANHTVTQRSLRQTKNLTGGISDCSCFLPSFSPSHWDYHEDFSWARLVSVDFASQTSLGPSFFQHTLTFFTQIPAFTFNIAILLLPPIVCLQCCPVLLNTLLHKYQCHTDNCPENTSTTQIVPLKMIVKRQCP